MRQIESDLSLLQLIEQTSSALPRRRGEAIDPDSSLCSHVPPDMFFWLFQHLFAAQPDIGSGLDPEASSFCWLRVAAAAITSLLIVLACGPWTFARLRTRCGERINSDSAKLNELHSAKQGTPTMGGLLIMAAVGVSSLLWADPANACVVIALGTAAGLTLIGAIDDGVKLKLSRKGLTARQKLASQLVVAGSAGFAICWTAGESGRATEILIPFGVPIVTPFPLAVLWAAFVIVGTSNAVNLTDGLDGLAAGCSFTSAAAITVVLLVSSNLGWAEDRGIAVVPDAGELAVVAAALAGGVAGFLKFNRYPAKVFMGDTGSLPIGGLLAVAALVSRREMLLIVIGGVFVIETLSVILQVGCFKVTGKRIIRCSPLHNHFLFRGDHETVIVKRFWLCSAALAGLGVLSLNSL